MMSDISRIILFISCMLCAIQDVRWRRIHVLTYLIFMLPGLLLSYMGERSPEDMILALIPGSLLYIASMITGQSIGKGDALWFLLAGLFCGLRDILFIFSIACFLCAFGALIVFATHGGNIRRLRGYRLPFMAFVPLPVLMGAFLGNGQELWTTGCG